MATLKKINDDLEAISVVSSIVDVYQKAAYSKMMDIRKGVLKTREFLTEVATVYHLAERSEEFYLENIKNKNPLSLIKEKKKEEVVVFLSANHFFYGNLILDTWLEARDYWKNGKADLVIVGRTGKYLAESYQLGDKIFCFDLDDQKPEKEKIGEIAEFIKEYKKVTVFHGRFESILVQNPAMTDVTVGMSSGEVMEEKKRYLFEPSPEAVLEFFETEIMMSLFNQTILEHALARHGVRMVSMHRASENAEKKRGEIERIKRRVERQKMDKEQIEDFSSFSLWRKKT